MFQTGLKCSRCDKDYPSDSQQAFCSSCDGPLNAQYDFNGISQAVSKNELNNRSVHLGKRYKEFLPLKNNFETLGEGWTPVVNSCYFSDLYQLDLYYKLESLNPTGSFKDRGNMIMISKIKDLGLNRIADDSSGNAGASLAAYAAKTGIHCTIYTPESASGPKQIQVQMYGAKLKTVSGYRNEVTEKIKADCSKTSRLYYASHNLNPYFIEGTKTIAYEISEQFNWQTPQNILFPVGGGGLIIGAYRGFAQLLDLGWIENMPRLHAVQSAACNPIVQAFNSSEKEIFALNISETVAEGIHISKPERGKEILSAINQTNGEAVEVDENAIKHFYRQLPAREGIYCEPTSAAALAGLDKLSSQGVIQKGESVLLPITGSGLKNFHLPKNLI